MITAPAKSERPRARVLRELREGIAGGRWTGGMLPTESDLVSVLGASRSTVRTVLKELETEGLLRAEQGRGRVVVAPQSHLMNRTVVILAASLVAPEHFRHTAAEKAVEAAAVDSLRASDRHVLALHAGALEPMTIERLVADRPCGVVVDHAVADLPAGQAALTALAAAKVPVVVYGNMPGLERFDRVVSDHERGAYELTQWLIGQGHRRICRVWEDIGRPYWIKARDRGFERAMREAGLNPAAPLCVKAATEPVDQDDPRAGEVFELRSRQYAGFMADVVLRELRPQVLMAMNDVSMLLAARAVRILGLKPGRDIALVGYDNFWPQSKDRRFESYIPLATVDKRNDLIGQRLVELLLSRLAGKLPPAPQIVMLNPQLVFSGAAAGKA